MQHKIEQRFKRVYNSRAHFHKVSYMFLFFFGSSHFCLHFLLIHLALSPPTLSPFPFPPPTPALFAAICYNILSGCCSIFSLWKHLSKQRVALRVCVAVFPSLSLTLCLCPCGRLFLSLLSGSLVRIITQRTYIALDFVVIAYGELVASPSPSPSSVSSVQFSSAQFATFSSLIKFFPQFFFLSSFFSACTLCFLSFRFCFCCVCCYLR